MNGDGVVAESPFATELPFAVGETALPSSWPEREDETPGTAAGQVVRPDVLMRWNAMSAPARIDVVVHFHGNNTQRAGVRLVADLVAISGLDLADPADPAGPGRRRPTLAILPRGDHVGSGRFRYPALDGAGALDAYVARGLEELAARTGVRAPRGRLVLTAHSGGGYAIERLLADNDPDELHLFDAFYPAPDQLIRWLRRRVEQDRAPAEAFRRSGALRALYRDPATRTHMQAAHTALCRALAGATGLADRYRIEQTSVRHCDIPRTYGWRLLADAAADLPATTPIRCSHRAGATEWEALHAEGERWAEPGGREAGSAEHEWEGRDRGDLEQRDPEREELEDLDLEGLEWAGPGGAEPEGLGRADREWADREWADREWAGREWAGPGRADPELEEWGPVGPERSGRELEDRELEDHELEDHELEDHEWAGLERADLELEDLGLEEWQDPAAEELFEAEEFARHAAYDDGEGEAAASRPAIRSTAFLRRAWHADACAEARMVPLRLFGRWNTPVNPATVDAWRALERALTGAGYAVHRAWVFNCRTIRGQRTRSLHAYGLAVDIDHARPTCNVNRATPDGRAVRFSPAATKEERCRDVSRGTADTSFTAAQVAAVEAVRTVDGQQVFAWGGRWRTTKDTMHFQINVTPEELARGIRSGASSESEFEDQAATADRYGHIAVTPGGFGRALRRFARDWAVPDSVLWLLARSPTFLATARALDERYVEGVVGAPAGGTMSDDGVLTDGPSRGRRRIFFHPSSHGSFFRTYADPDNTLAGDVIWLQRPPDTGDPTAPTTLGARGRWLEMIAHESVHADRFVRGLRRPGTTPAERVRAAIDDEIATRGVERAIVDELRVKFPRFAAYPPTTGSRDRAAVERDGFPGEQRRTYLEQFVLGELRAAARREVTDEQAKQYERIVAGISLGKPPHTALLSLNPTFVHRTRGRIPLLRLRYPNVLLALRVVAARWEAAQGVDDAGRERMRQEHAAAFFDGMVGYTPR